MAANGSSLKPFDINKLADIEAMIKSRIKNCNTGLEANEEGVGEDQKPKGKR